MLFLQPLLTFILRPCTRSAQSHRSSVDFDPSAAVGTQGPMFPPLTLQPIVQGGGLMTSYGALRQEIRGTGNASGGSGGSFSAYGAGKAMQGGYAAKAAARAIQGGRYPPGAVILPGGGFDDRGDLPEGWDLKERPQGLLNLIHEGSKSFSGSTGWSHHPFILPPEEPLQHHPHPKTKQTGSYASRASERISSNMEGPSAAKSSGSSGSLAKELKSKSSSSLQPDQPSPLSTSSSNSVAQIQSVSAVAQKPVPQVAPPTSAATAAAATQSAAHAPRKYAPPPVTSQLGEEAVKVQAPLQQPSTSKASRPPAAGMTSGS